VCNSQGLSRFAFNADEYVTECHTESFISVIDTLRVRRKREG